MVLEKTLKSPLDSKEIQPVNPKGNQPWVFIGRIDTEPKAPILWPPDVKNQFIGKDCDAGKNWGREEKVATENEMAGWHRWLNGHEFEQTLGDSEGQRNPACCHPWCCQESDMNEQVNNKLKLHTILITIDLQEILKSDSMSSSNSFLFKVPFNILGFITTLVSLCQFLKEKVWWHD